MANVDGKTKYDATQLDTETYRIIESSSSSPSSWDVDGDMVVSNQNSTRTWTTYILQSIPRSYYFVLLIALRAPSYLPPAITTIGTTENIPISPVSCNEGQYIPDPADCGSYYRCVLKELKRERCAPGLHWDKSRGICDWPSISKCRADISKSFSFSWSLW